MFNNREIIVISMMNDEQFKNLTISCNHVIKTTQSYELSLRKYRIYLTCLFKNFLKKLKRVRWTCEMENPVGWNENWLNICMACFNYAAGTVRKEMNLMRWEFEKKNFRYHKQCWWRWRYYYEAFGLCWMLQDIPEIYILVWYCFFNDFNFKFNTILIFKLRKLFK